MKRIRKVLIANRGEIAVRIIRSCKELDVSTVAVFSEVDRLSPHVLMADEAYPIGPAPSSRSYLNMEKIIAVALESGADAVHPGYGFLAENPTFARKVSEAGLIFIGPSAETIRMMGSKTESRKIMQEAGVPVVPGTTRAIKRVAEAQAIIESIGGYPVMLKAAAGGGGKGMRIVRKAEELPRALEAGRSEALKAFGDDTIYIEKLVESPKHIEIQILADHEGHIVHLWERDCSIQRRHQKVIEECPSAILPPEVRARMGATAVQAARACGYVNAGTVEFLVDENLNFYFLEMNTRLQVEHPVTEMVLGIDLVKLQIQVAEGSPLPLRQEAIQARGHAIECRIYAEDPFHNFAPSTGRIQYLKHPEGPGVRLDSGIASHSEITMYYDPLMAKLITWGSNRREAIARMIRALKEYQVHGVRTTIPFCLAVLQHPDFQEGRFNTGFVDACWPDCLPEVSGDEAVDAVAAALRYLQEQQKVYQDGHFVSRERPPQPSAWKIRGLKEMMRER